MLVRTTEVVPIECVVRGFISGSAWKEYSETGALGGERLPEGLTESASIDPPIFSPATKAEEGHDENIPFSRMCEEIGRDLATTLRDISLAIYERARQIAQDAGIILADTKFEFGKLPDGTLLLIDEVLTPDSSRFWPAASYAPGRGQPSLDKQPVRDYLDQLVQKSEWNREPPPPDLPPEVVRATSERYLDAFRQLTGMQLEQFRATDP
jgi:phosphoribosylaminoimidazole-succinocarboxamide synthase